MVQIKRDTYWQCGFIITKDDFENINARGLEKFREEIVEIAPHFRNRVHELKQWDDIKLLSVRVDRLKEWSRPGLLCIGDAAHAMSPIGGVGINLAVQDAVAAGNLLIPKFLEGKVTLSDLQAVEKRRRFPTRATQALQVFLQNRVISRTLQNQTKLTSLPWQLKLFQQFPLLRRGPARIIGLGFRPEHLASALR